MERNNGKVIAILALVVGVVALSVGFAAFSATLNITNASANMTATNEFTNDVNYSSAATKCYKTGDTSTTGIITSGYSSGTATGKNWNGIKVPLTKDDHSVTCEAEIENASPFLAYLKTISSNGAVQCASAVNDSTAAGYASNASDFCDATTGTTVTVTIGSENDNVDTLTFSNASGSVSATHNTIAANNGSTNGTTPIYVTINYPGSSVADGEVLITIPTISFEYSTTR